MAVAKLERVPRRQYRAADGAGFNDEAAQRYGRFLERKGLGKRPVSPEEIVEFAKPEGSPLHERFTWDNAAAADEHRLNQARHLVSHIVYSMEVAGEQVEARAFHNVTSRNGETKRGYVSDRIVWSRSDYTEQVVTKAMRELKSWHARYHTYQVLGSSVAKVEEALAVDVLDKAA